MRARKTLRSRLVLGASVALLLNLLVLRLHQTTAFFFRTSRELRCRECGALERSRTVALLDVVIYDRSAIEATPLSRILIPDGHPACEHQSFLPVRNTEILCAPGPDPWWRSTEQRFSDVSHLADNATFLREMQILSRTNLTEARYYWRCLAREDYRAPEGMGSGPSNLPSPVRDFVVFLVQTNILSVR